MSEARAVAEDDVFDEIDVADHGDPGTDVAKSVSRWELADRAAARMKARIPT